MSGPWTENRLNLGGEENLEKTATRDVLVDSSL